MTKPKPKLTPWYPASIKPVRVGGYEYCSYWPFLCYWDGTNFFDGDGMFKGQPMECFEGDQWRELAAKP